MVEVTLVICRVEPWPKMEISSLAVAGAAAGADVARGCPVVFPDRVAGGPGALVFVVGSLVAGGVWPRAPGVFVAAWAGRVMMASVEVSRTERVRRAFCRGEGDMTPGRLFLNCITSP
ncbi:hypothetical protein [Acetobacter oeni]|nr:hypothetical protein [Acetobacter oeni]